MTFASPRLMVEGLHYRAIVGNGDTVIMLLLQASSNARFRLSAQKAARMFALIALERVCDPEQGVVDHGAIIPSRIHDTGLYDEAAQFDQMLRELHP